MYMDMYYVCTMHYADRLKESSQHLFSHIILFLVLGDGIEELTVPMHNAISFPFSCQNLKQV